MYIATMPNNISPSGNDVTTKVVPSALYFELTHSIASTAKKKKERSINLTFELLFNLNKKNYHKFLQMYRYQLMPLKIPSEKRMFLLTSFSTIPK